MAFQLTLVDANATPLPTGLDLVLIGDGVTIAKGTVEEGGIVRFEAVLDGIKRLVLQVNVEPSASAPEG